MRDYIDKMRELALLREQKEEDNREIAKLEAKIVQHKKYLGVSQTSIKIV
jgi:hypothetical protein